MLLGLLEEVERIEEFIRTYIFGKMEMDYVNDGEIEVLDIKGILIIIVVCFYWYFF